MKKRIDYRRSLEINKKKKRMAKLGILSAFGMIGLMSATPAFASEWSANAPESISIEQGSTSYTMKQGDTLWAIGMKINVNVNTLASVNNINLSNGEQFTMPVGTVINFSESEIKAVNSNGQAVNEGVKVNDSNKIVKDKPVGTDVSKDVSNGTVTNNDVVGQPDNTGKLPAPNTGGTTKPEEKPSTGGDNGAVNPVEPEKPTNPTNEDKFVVINVDTDGNKLDSTEGYTFISESTDKKVDMNDNGNTTTTYTTTKVWSKDGETPTEPTNEDRFVVVNVDVDGNALESTDGYTFFSESTASSVETLENKNTITTYTTTKIWTKDGQEPETPTNKDVFVTVNVDVNGTVLLDTTGYTFLSESTNTVVETLENGNTISTHTTTKVWKLAEAPTNENKYVTINVNEKGVGINSTDGYEFISESTQSSIQTLPNGNTITTYTTTKVWRLIPTTPPSGVTPVNPSDVGNSGILHPDIQQAAAQGEAMHNDPNSEFNQMWIEDGIIYGYGWKTAQVPMTDGSKWYTVIFYLTEEPV